MAFPLVKTELQLRVWPLIAVLIALCIAAALSYWALYAVAAIFGTNWMSATRHQLVDWGVPAQFVTGYIYFVLLHLPKWTALAAITFSLGLIRLRRAHQLAWALSAAVPVVDVLFAALFSSPFGLYVSPTSLGLRVYVFIPACGSLVGVAAWWAGYFLRGRHYRAMGRCTACGYDLRGADSTACPECGHLTGNPAI